MKKHKYANCLECKHYHHTYDRCFAMYPKKIIKISHIKRGSCKSYYKLKWYNNKELLFTKIKHIYETLIHLV